MAFCAVVLSFEVKLPTLRVVISEMSVIHHLEEVFSTKLDPEGVLRNNKNKTLGEKVW